MSIQSSAYDKLLRKFQQYKLGAAPPAAPAGAMSPLREPLSSRDPRASLCGASDSQADDDVRRQSPDFPCSNASLPHTSEHAAVSQGNTGGARGCYASLAAFGDEPGAATASVPAGPSGCSTALPAPGVPVNSTGGQQTSAHTTTKFADTLTQAPAHTQAAAAASHTRTPNPTTSTRLDVATQGATAEHSATSPGSLPTAEDVVVDAVARESKFGSLEHILSSNALLKRTVQVRSSLGLDLPSEWRASHDMAGGNVSNSNGRVQESVRRLEERQSHAMSSLSSLGSAKRYGRGSLMWYDDAFFSFGWQPTSSCGTVLSASRIAGLAAAGAASAHGSPGGVGYCAPPPAAAAGASPRTPRDAPPAVRPRASECEVTDSTSAHQPRLQEGDGVAGPVPQVPTHGTEGKNGSDGGCVEGKGGESGVGEGTDGTDGCDERECSPDSAPLTTNPAPTPIAPRPGLRIMNLPILGTPSAQLQQLSTHKTGGAGGIGAGQLTHRGLAGALGTARSHRAKRTPRPGDTTLRTERSMFEDENGIDDSVTSRTRNPPQSMFLTPLAVLRGQRDVSSRAGTGGGLRHSQSSTESEEECEGITESCETGAQKCDNAATKCEGGAQRCEAGSEKAAQKPEGAVAAAAAVVHARLADKSVSRSASATPRGPPSAGCTAATAGAASRSASATPQGARTATSAPRSHTAAAVEAGKGCGDSDAPASTVTKTEDVEGEKELCSDPVRRRLTSELLASNALVSSSGEAATTCEPEAHAV